MAESPDRVEWSKKAIAETVEIFFSGISQSGQAAEHPISVPDYGKGVAGVWEEFRADNANAAQYLNLNKILGSGFPSAHFNLCGELAVSAILGLELSEGLRLFMQVPPTDKSTEVLKKGATSFGSQLAGLFNLGSEGTLKA
ncbi:MAG: hypothetical protein GTN65_12040, partial [Armatimonadetes bacterium]|nr:hypothetical protein [Armatimonadota bacterium]NIO97797.1 hypothetical protein [Armatimonadota bacterium]